MIHKRWYARITKNNKVIFNGYSNDEIKCARKRDLFIIKNLKNDCYKLNFEWIEDEILLWEKTFEEERYKRKII